MKNERIKSAKVKLSNGEYGPNIPLGVDAENIDLKNGKDLETSMVFYDTTQNTDIEVNNEILTGGDVINNLSSSASSQPLSANMGRVLNENKINQSDVSVFPLEQGQRVKIGTVEFDINTNYEGSGSLGGTTDYQKLINKPKINGIELLNNQNGRDLNLVSMEDIPASLPASDVYPWAKEKEKPVYNKTEVGLSNVENKSSQDILNELKASDIQRALGDGGLQDIITASPNTIYNILVNGDFFCWQRGSTLTNKESKFVYGPDMWMYSPNSTVEQTDRGLYIKQGTNVVLIQKIVFKNYDKQPAILIKSINGKKTVEKITIDFGGRKSFEIKIMGLNQGDTVNYVHLFLGSVEPTYEQEPRTIALLRCQRWLKVGMPPYNTNDDLELLLTTKTTDTTTEAVKIYDLPFYFTPSVHAKLGNIVNIDGREFSIKEGSIIPIWISPYRIFFSMKHASNNIFVGRCVYIKYIASCEPID